MNNAQPHIYLMRLYNNIPPPLTIPPSTYLAMNWRVLQANPRLGRNDGDLNTHKETKRPMAPRDGAEEL